jgi:hypothetical protein
MIKVRIFRLFLGLVLISGIGFCSYNFSTAETRVRGLCSQITPGMSLVELRTFAQRHGLGPVQPHDGLNYMVETRSFGRHGCRTLVKSGVVQESDYTFAD